MSIPSHSSQAVKPPCRPSGPSHGMSVTPREAPDDRDVALVAVAEGLRGAAQDAPPGSSWQRAFRPASPPAPRRVWDGRASTVPPRHPRPRNPSGWPGTVSSGSTMIRPFRSVSAPVAAATRRANDEAATPAPHRTVRAASRSVRPPVPSPIDTATPSSSMSVTRVPSRTSHAEPLELALRRGRRPRIRRQNPVHAPRPG